MRSHYGHRVGPHPTAKENPPYILDRPPFGAGGDMVGVGRVGGRDQQFVTADTAAVLGRSGSASARADGAGHGLITGQDGLQPDHVAPVVAEIVGVEQFVADVDQDLVEAHLFFRHPVVALLDQEGAQVVLGVGAAIRRAAAELVQMRVSDLPARGAGVRCGYARRGS